MTIANLTNRLLTRLFPISDPKPEDPTTMTSANVNSDLQPATVINTVVDAKPTIQPTEEPDMATLHEMQAQLAELQRQIAETTQREKADTIAQIKQIMADHGLTMADIAGGGSGKRGRPAGSSAVKGMKVPAKYRDEATGNEWSGRGMMPTWLKGKNKDDYLIKT